MNKKGMYMVIGAAVLFLGYRWMQAGGLEGMKGIRDSETTVPDYDQPNMKTKVPAGANNNHIWLVKG